MLQDKKVRVYHNDLLEGEVPEGVLVEYANPRLFVTPRTNVDFFISDNQKVIAGYSNTDTKRIYSLQEALGVEDLDTEPDEPTPIKPAYEPELTEPTPEIVQKETDHLTHDEIRSAPFFTQKKMVKEKYGVVAKNKEEIEAVLANNE